MKTFNIIFGLEITVEADDEDEAISEAREQMRANPVKPGDMWVEFRPKEEKRWKH